MSPIVILTNETMFDDSWMLVFVEYRVAGRDEIKPLCWNHRRDTQSAQNVLTPVRWMYAALGDF